jgi:hypothetical protein
MVFRVAGTLNSQGIAMNEHLLAEAKALQADLKWFIGACNTIHEQDAQMLVHLSNVMVELIKGYEDANAAHH